MNLFEYDEKQDADGVDFVSLTFNLEKFPLHVSNVGIYASYTKEEFENVKYIPKTNRRYWKIINGEKVYI